MFREQAYRTLSVTLGLVFLLAGASKVADPRAVAETISFVLFERPASSLLPLTLAMVVISLEVTTGLLLVIGRPSTRVIGFAVSLIGVFTLVLMKLATNPGSPDCGYFALVRLQDSEAARAGSGLVRNGALLVATLWMLSASRSMPERASAGLPTRIRRRQSHANGFTIVELLVTISIATVLISLAMPSFFGSRLRAKMTWSLSTQRQVLASVFLYTVDNDDVLPHLGEHSAIGPGLIHHDGATLGRSYFQTHLFYWSSLIYPAYFDNLAALESDSLPHESYTQDVLGLKNQVRSNFLMSYNAWADYRFWNDGSPKPTVRLLRATRTGEIRFPSQKGLLLDAKRGALNQDEFPGYRNLSVGRADGSAGELDWWSVPLSAVYSNPDWPVQWKLPVLATRDGLSGRDF